MISTATKRITAAFCAVALIGLSAGGLLYAREETAPPKVEAQHLMTKPVAGEPGKEIDIQVYTFPPGSAVPWHIHPGAHEIEYGLEGTLMIEEEGKAPYPLKAGASNYLAPDVVHRGWNASQTEPAKVYVVRIKPVDAPLAELVTPTSRDATPGAPKAGAYPGVRP